MINTCYLHYTLSGFKSNKPYVNPLLSFMKSKKGVYSLHLLLKEASFATLLLSILNAALFCLVVLK